MKFLKLTKQRKLMKGRRQSLEELLKLKGLRNMLLKSQRKKFLLKKKPMPITPTNKFLMKIMTAQTKLKAPTLKAKIKVKLI